MALQTTQKINEKIEEDENLESAVFVESDPADSKFDFLRASPVSKALIVINLLLAAVYFAVVAFWFKHGDTILFYALIAGEIFHLFQLVTFSSTVWNRKRPRPPFDPLLAPPVDVFIPVVGEPVEIVEETVRAASAMDYPAFQVFVLNDGYVRGVSTWREIEIMAEMHGARVITRKVSGGGKAGNINNALKETTSPLVAVFDSDHVPHADFLRKTVGYMADQRVAFVQTPQYYKNWRANAVTGGAWEQQQLFFGPICKGKDEVDAVTMCGTNMLLRRSALDEVGGIDYSIAEDFVTGLKLHSRGWKSRYVPEVLAEGLAPEDFQSYWKQQYRWARGALDALFSGGLLWKRGLKFRQRFQYVSSLSYFVSGFIVAINALFPLAFFFFGRVPLYVSSMALASVFLPYILATFAVLVLASNYSFTWRSLSFSLASFPIQVEAFIAALFGKRDAFHVTAKRAENGNYVRFVRLHILYILLVAAGITVTILREGITPSAVANFGWALLYVAVFTEFIVAAMPSERGQARTARGLARNSLSTERG